MAAALDRSVDGPGVTPTYTIYRYPSLLIDRVVLARGRSVIVRPVLPQDAALLQAFVTRLSPRTRHLRFHFGLSGLTDALSRSLSEVDYRSHLALVAETGAADGGPSLVADARYVVREDRATAEFGIVIADDWQGCGLGRALLRKLALCAQQQGLVRLVGDVLSHNHRMQALVRGLGGQIRPHFDDESLVNAEFLLRPA